MAAVLPLKDFAEALGCKEKAVGVRLAALGHSEYCGRCGGGGHYSYCPAYGTTCFGCSGSGKKMPKLTPKLLEVVKAEVAAGKLEPYLAKLKADFAAKKVADGAWNAYMAAWGSNPSAAKWNKVHFMKCPEEHHAVNAACARVIDLLKTYTSAYKDGCRYEKVKVPGSYPKSVKIPLTDEDKAKIVSVLPKMISYAGEAEKLLGEHPTREGGEALGNAKVKEFKAEVGF